MVRWSIAILTAQRIRTAHQCFVSNVALPHCLSVRPQLRTHLLRLNGHGGRAPATPNQNSGGALFPVTFARFIGILIVLARLC